MDLVEALVATRRELEEANSGGIGRKDLVEGFGGGKWWRYWWKDRAQTRRVLG
jgi:hypothetical protein